MKYKVFAISIMVLISVSCLKKPYEAARINTADREFVNEIFACNRTIKDAAHLALTKATDTQVYLFAAELAHTHNNVHNDLQHLAELLEIPLSPEVDGRQLLIGQQLSCAKGQAFDSLIIHTQITYHNTAISLVNKEVQYGYQADLVNYAKSLLPALSMQLQKAEALADKY